MLYFLHQYMLKYEYILFRENFNNLITELKNEKNKSIELVNIFSRD